MKSIVLPLCAALVFATGAVHAADDPLLGTWKADVSPGGDIKGQTMTIATAPGGYSFETDIHPAQGDEMKLALPVIPDGKSHTTNTAYGPTTATCRRSTPRTIECATTFAGSGTDSTFALSADGKTLTETDVNDVQQVHYSSKTDISVDNGTASQGPTTGSTQTSTSKETETTVFHRQ